MKATAAFPIFQVANIPDALRFYTETLGFTQEFCYGEPPYYAAVRLGEIVLHLGASECNQSRLGMGSVYIYVDDVDAYYFGLDYNGPYEITSPITTHPYGIRDFQISDPDGNLLCFGQEV